MTAERRSALADLLERETAGMSELPWTRITVGHRDVFQIASAVLGSLTAGEFTNTDATWIDIPGGNHAAFIGNGPKQTVNGDAIVALANHLPDILLELRGAAAREGHLRERIDAMEVRAWGRNRYIDKYAVLALLPPAPEGTK